MKAVGQQSDLAHELETGAGDADRQALEQSISSTSGTYFRAPRPSEQQAAPLARSESIIDGAKSEGRRFELEGRVWQMDSERIARCVIADAEYVAGTDGDEE